MSQLDSVPSNNIFKAHQIFKGTKPEYQVLIRDFLREERDVMHLQRRNDIHHRLYEHIKRVVK